MDAKELVRTDREAAESLYMALEEELWPGQRKPRKSYSTKNVKRDYCQTPPYAVRLLLPYLPEDVVIWEPAAGEGYLAWALMEAGYEVIQTDLRTSFDFLRDEPDFDYDVIITNPPYQAQKKLAFIERCYELRAIWCLLMQDTTRFNKKPGELFAKYSVDLIVPDGRIDYFMPDKGYTHGGSQFTSLWYTWGLEMSQPITQVPLNKPGEEDVIAEIERLRARWVETFQVQDAKGQLWTQPMLIGM